MEVESTSGEDKPSSTASGRDRSQTEPSSSMEELKRGVFEGVLYELKARYTPEKTIGKGAFGSVLAVRDAVSGERRAVKKQTSVFERPGRAKQALRESV